MCTIFEAPSINSHLNLITSLSVINSYGLKIDAINCDLPYVYWTPKLYKCPYKQCYIAGPSMCSTKPLSKSLTLILTIIKDGLQRCCETIRVYS